MVDRLLVLGLEVPSFLNTHTFVCAFKWAGLGTMTSAMKYIQHAMAEVAGVNIEMHLHSMVDHDPTCLSMLRPFKPQHLFSDLMEAFPPDLVQTIRDRQTVCLRLFSLCPYTGKEKTDYKLECVREFQSFVNSISLRLKWPTR